MGWQRMENLTIFLFGFALMLDTCSTTRTYIMVPSGVPTPIPRPSIVLEESYGNAWGAKALFIRDSSEFKAEDGYYNYWVAKQGQNSKIIWDLGEKRGINSIDLINYHNGLSRDRSTREFTVSSGRVGNEVIFKFCLLINIQIQSKTLRSSLQLAGR